MRGSYWLWGHICRTYWKPLLEDQSKLHVLATVVNFMSLGMHRSVHLFFFQFKYCPLTWMWHSRNPNDKLNRLQVQGLLALYTLIKCSTFYQLHEKDKSVKIHKLKLVYRRLLWPRFSNSVTMLLTILDVVKF